MAFDYAKWLSSQPRWDSVGNLDSPVTDYTQKSLFRQRDLVSNAWHDKQYGLLPFFATVAGAITTEWRDPSNAGYMFGEVQFYRNPWALRNAWKQAQNEFPYKHVDYWDSH